MPAGTECFITEGLIEDEEEPDLIVVQCGKQKIPISHDVWIKMFGSVAMNFTIPLIAKGEQVKDPSNNLEMKLAIGVELVHDLNNLFKEDQLQLQGIAERAKGGFQLLEVQLLEDEI